MFPTQHNIPAFSQDAITKAAQDSKNETLWGKPANDIINGRDTAAQYEPVRAIWEMVQNARDVNEGKCNIEFCRRTDTFLFRHNGLPFTNHTLDALILQTSSKMRDDMWQVGQYGTGFLTTHLLGRKFELEGSLQLLDDKDCYCNFSGFVVDRTPNDKKKMVDNLEGQFKAKDELITQSYLWSEKPSELTSFTYFQPNLKERLNAKECFEKSKSVIPYVMCLNPNIQSITLNDEVEQTETIFEKIGTEIVDVTHEKYVVRHTNIYISEENKQQRQIISLESKETVTTHNDQVLPKVTVIIPVENNRVYSLDRNIARLFLFLPLIGTEAWGVNFIIHSPAFTCATENRSSLRLVNDGQGNSCVVDTNRDIISLATDIIFNYAQLHLKEWNEVKLLAPITFEVNNRNEELSEYYNRLKETWLKNMYRLQLVEVDNNKTFQLPNCVFVLEKELADAAEETPMLLTSLHNIMCKMHGKKFVPKEEDLIYWSNVFAEWYGTKENKYISKLADIVEYVSGEKLVVSETDQLELCKYIKVAHKEEYFDQNILLTEEGGLTNKTEGLMVAFCNEELQDCLSVLMPDKTNKFLKPEFAALVKVPTFSLKEIKEAMPGVIDSLYKGIEPIWKASKMGEDINENDDRLLIESEIYALMNYCRLIIPSTSTAFEAKSLILLEELWNIELTTQQDDILLHSDLEWRASLRFIINASLGVFTLLDDTEKQECATIVKNIVTEVYGYSDFRPLLKNHQCYRSQTGEYHYCDELKKDNGIPDEMKDIYNKIRITKEGQVVDDIRSTLFDKEFALIADTEAQMDSPALGKLIMDEIMASQTYLNEIDTYMHRDLVVQIIDHLNDTEEGKLWISSFEKINNDLGALLMKLVLQTESREPMIQIMKVKDVNKIKKAAEIIMDDHLMEILELGEQVWIQKKNQQADFEIKMKLGKYVEDYLRAELSEELANVDIIVDVDDEQGGQDIIIKKAGKPVYFIEVKSRWGTTESVMMSALQLQRSVEEQDRYALFAADMTEYSSEYLKVHRYPDSNEEIVKRIRVIPTIGELNGEIIPAPYDPQEDVHISGDYKSVVPQKLIQRKGMSYDDFLRNVLVPIVTRLDNYNR